jgi:hypothetical protein
VAGRPRLIILDSDDLVSQRLCERIRCVIGRLRSAPAAMQTRLLSGAHPQEWVFRKSFTECRIPKIGEFLSIPL